MESLTKDKLEFMARSRSFETTINDQRKNVEGSLKSIRGEADKTNSALQAWVSSESKVRSPLLFSSPPAGVSPTVFLICVLSIFHLCLIAGQGQVPPGL